MNMINQNPGFPASPAGIGGIPGAPTRVATPAPAAPQAPADAVTLGQAPPAPAAPVPQVVHTPSGVDAQVLCSQQGLAFEAALPAGAGGLIPVGLLLQGITDGKQGQVQASVAGNQQPLPAAIGNDGRVYVQVEAGAPLVSFDPATLDFGLSSPMTVDQAGTQRRQLHEIVHADGNRMVIHDEQIKPGPQGTQERTFTRIDDRNGLVSGAQYTMHEGGKAAAPQQSTAMKIGMAVLTNGMSLLMPQAGGAPRDEQTAVTVQRQPNGAYSLAGGSFMDHAKKAATGGLRFESPLMNWMKGRNAPAVTVMPFSAVLATNPGAVFPGVMAALAAESQAQQAAAAAPQQPQA